MSNTHFHQLKWASPKEMALLFTLSCRIFQVSLPRPAWELSPVLLFYFLQSVNNLIDGKGLWNSEQLFSSLPTIEGVERGKRVGQSPQLCSEVTSHQFEREHVLSSPKGLAWSDYAGAKGEPGEHSSFPLSKSSLEPPEQNSERNQIVTIYFKIMYIYNFIFDYF